MYKTRATPVIDYIPISQLNDFIFCPYSIYLHGVYIETEDDVYKASPQVDGTIAHHSINSKTASTRKDDICSLSVYSDQLGIYGKIYMLKQDTHTLIERKNHLKRIYRGQLYQLWGQYFCLIEMGYEVQKIAFYEISTNKMVEVDLPGDAQWQELSEMIEKFKNYIPDSTQIATNPNKCSHCIYCNLCDKTNMDNVYT